MTKANYMQVVKNAINHVVLAWLFKNALHVLQPILNIINNALANAHWQHINKIVNAYLAKQVVLDVKIKHFAFNVMMIIYLISIQIMLVLQAAKVENIH